MSEKTKSPEGKPSEPIPAKPAATELSDKALEQVSGGIGHGNELGTVKRGAFGGTSAIEQDVQVHKAKTADKAYQQMDAYIKG